jgi:hypothetical protein
MNCLALLMILAASAGDLSVTVAAEEDIFLFTPPNNGSGPLWSFGNSQIARLGDSVVVCEQQTGKDMPLLCNTRWVLHRRSPDGKWDVLAQAEGYRQREPAPIGTMSDRILCLNVNDSNTEPGTKYGNCIPRLMNFDLKKAGQAPAVFEPKWAGAPHFTDHSYRGFAADRKHDKLVMMNIDAKTSVEHATLMTEKGKSIANGSITFPIRACYPQVALHKRAVHVFAVGDIVEPVKEWREYKFAQTKQTWDYVFRILYYAYTPDLKKADFRKPLEIANVDATAGYARNHDLWLAPNGDAYLIYTQQEVHSALLRDKFFPGKSVVPSLHLAVIHEGEIVRREILMEASDKRYASNARFQELADGRMIAVLSVQGEGAGVKVMPIYPELSRTLADVPLEKPIHSFCLATVRAGNAPSNTVDMFGETKPNQYSYAQFTVK